MSLDVFLEQPARQSVECYKQSFLEHSSESLEDSNTNRHANSKDRVCGISYGGSEDFFQELYWILESINWANLRNSK